MKVLQRDPFIDNARYILVLLVVFGHIISPWREDSELVYGVNNLLASFRMPALILLTGYFAKSFYKSGYIKKITIKLFVPLIILQIFYSLYYTAYGDTINLFLPRMGLWFLLSLYYFNLLLFPFSKLKHPIIVSIIFGMGIGMINEAGSFLSIARTFVFFPFFLIGFYAQKSHIEYIKKYSNKVVSILLFMAIIYIMNFFSFEEVRGVLLGKFPFERLGFSNVVGLIARALSYVIMIAGILAIFAWVPKERTIFTELGQKTAYIYLLHLIVIRYFYSINWFQEYAVWKLPFVFLFAIIITMLLSSKFIVNLTKPVIEGSVIYYIKNWNIKYISQTAQNLKVKIKNSDKKVS